MGFPKAAIEAAGYGAAWWAANLEQRCHPRAGLEPLVTAQNCRAFRTIRRLPKLLECLRKAKPDVVLAVWIGGTSTNTCCESTARDAMLLDFRTTMISDANADHNDEEHNATLINFCINFGDVASTDDLIQRLQPAALNQSFRSLTR